MKIYLALGILICTLMFVGSIEGLSVPEAQIELKSRELVLSNTPTSDSNYFIIQMKETPNFQRKAELKSRGIEIIEYVSEDSWIVSADPKSISGLNGIRFADIKSEDKKGFVSGNRISVVFYPNVDKSRAREVIEKHGHVISEPIVGNVWYAEIEDVDALLEEDFVKWIQSRPALMSLNNDARFHIGVDTVQSLPYGLNGSGVTLAEWDVGWADMHQALADRIFIGDSSSCGDPVDTGLCGGMDHSTHVAGTMIGNGSGSNGLWGIAPEANLVTYEWPDSYYELITETNHAITDHDSIVSQNSWGYNVHENCSLLGDYDIWSAYYDNLTRGSDLDRPITFVFAAGNERSTGTDQIGKYYCGAASQGGHTYKTVTGPGGTAKNTIAVGALDKDGTMSYYSSWGPTDDGRIKPDIVAIGTNVNSTITDDEYELSMGTSMAAPAISGVIGLIYEDANSLGKDFLPSTIRGLLIHTANDINNTGPDYTTGWGIVDATSAINKLREDINNTNVIVENSLINWENKTYQFYVAPGQDHIKLTLIWDDYPGSVAAVKELVNDLDIIAMNSNETYYPWTLDYENPAANAVQNKRDDLNNVEQVFISNPNSGTWTVLINGTIIPEAPQSYSLISSNDFDVELPYWISYETNLTSVYDPEMVSIFSIVWSETDLDDVVIEGNWSGVPQNYTMQKNASLHEYNTTLPAGVFYWRSWANNTIGEVNVTDSHIFTVNKSSYVALNLTLNEEENVTVDVGDHVNVTSILNIPGNITIYRNGTEILNGSSPLNYLMNTTNTTLGIHEITAVFSGDQNYISTSDTNILEIVDTVPPMINTPTIFPRLISNSYNVTISADVTDNYAIGLIWFNVSNSTWSEDVTSDLPYTYDTENLDNGIYDVIIFANDTTQNHVNASAGSFDIVDETQLVLNFFDHNFSDLTVDEIDILYSSTENIFQTYQNVTNVSESLPSGLWDVYIDYNFDVMYEKLNSTNTTRNISLDYEIDESTLTLPPNVLFFATTISTETDADFERALIEFAFDNSSFINQNRTVSYACHNWDMLSRSCLGSWNDITENTTINTTTGIATVETSETSAFSIGESYSCGDGVIDAGETCNTCPQDAGSCPPPVTSSPGGGSSYTPPKPKKKEIMITTEDELTFVKSSSFIITVENTGDVDLTEVSLISDSDCDTCEIKISPKNVDLEAGKADNFLIEFSGNIMGVYETIFFLNSEENVTNSSITTINLLECDSDEVKCDNLNFMYCDQGKWNLKETCNYKCTDLGCEMRPKTTSEQVELAEPEEEIKEPAPDYTYILIPVALIVILALVFIPKREAPQKYIYKHK